MAIATINLFLKPLSIGKAPGDASKERHNDNVDKKTMAMMMIATRAIKGHLGRRNNHVAFGERKKHHKKDNC